MSAHSHPAPAQIRSGLDHPVIDGDGHWVEFDPVFAERMRKVGGDLAADGFLAALKTTTDALSMSVAERSRRRIAQPAFWSRQAENTLDRATAMMPQAALRAAAGVRHRLRDHLSDRGAAPAADPRRCHPPRGDSRAQRRDRGRLPQPGRPDDAGGDHPDAHARGGHRRARVRHARAGGEGGDVRQRDVATPPGDALRPRRRAPRRLVRRARAGQRVRLRPGVGQVPGARHRPDLPQLGQQSGPAPVTLQLRVQPHRPLRRRRPRRLQGRSSWAA